MVGQLEAMILAIKTVQPMLVDFGGALTHERQSCFNMRTGFGE
jgi:hypothetical protein